MKSIYKKTITIATITASIFMASHTTASEQCYVWTGNNGVKHYGNIPPVDVVATTIACKNKATKKDSATDDITAQQRKAQAERKAQCDEEKNRLKSLQTSGTRIRMIDLDGTPKYLTEDEVKKEIGLSESFISKNCK